MCEVRELLAFEECLWNLKKSGLEIYFIGKFFNLPLLWSKFID